MEAINIDSAKKWGMSATAPGGILMELYENEDTGIFIVTVNKKPAYTCSSRSVATKVIWRIQHGKSINKLKGCVSI